MKRFRRGWNRRTAVLLAAVCFLSAVPQPARAEEAQSGSYVPGQVLILYDGDVSEQEIISQQSGTGSEISVIFEGSGSTIASAELPEGVSVEEAVEQYGEQDGVLAVTPDYILEMYDADMPSADAAQESDGTDDPEEPAVNDADFGSQIYLQQIAAEEAWDFYQTNVHEKARVAVLDSGADLDHPDLQNVVNRELSREVLDASGTMGTLLGDDYILGQNTDQGTGHGTHVCGIIAAEANNLQGIAGVGSCYDNSAVELVVVDVFSGVKTTSLSFLIRGMEYVTDLDVDVVNLSLGVKKSQIGDDSILKAACDNMEAAGITLVCASGNEGTADTGEITEVPGDYDSTIGVVAVDSENNRASFSNYGFCKDIAAPGSEIYSTLKGGGCGTMSGTSMAAPAVSAAAAMMYALQPDITPAGVKEILKSTSSPSEDPQIYNLGVLNCEAALKAVDSVRDLPFPDLDSGQWYYDYVAFVYDRGIMTGMSDGTFRPNENLCRAQFALILHRMSGEPENDRNSGFPDISPSDWYVEAVTWAVRSGVVTGFVDTGLFGPTWNITREQLVTMLYRYAGYCGYDTADRASLSGYADGSLVSEYARVAMEWAVGAGIISGKYEETQLDPQGNATRAECAAVIERFLGAYETES